MADDFNRIINQGADRLIQSIRDIRTTTAIREANAAADEIKAGAESDAIKESQLRQVANALTNQLAQTGAINPAAAVGAIAPKTPFFQTAEQAFINQGTTAERGQRAEQLIGFQQEQALAAEQRKEAKDARARTVKGLGVAPTKEDARDLRKALADANKAEGNINRLLEFTEKPFARINPSDRARANVLRRGVVAALRLPFLGGGVLSDQDRQTLEDAVADPTGLFNITPVTRAALNELRGALTRGVEAEARARGVEGGQQAAQGQASGTRTSNTADFQSFIIK